MREEKRPAVKRLKKAVKPAKSKDNIFHTKQVADRQEAIDSKLKLLRGSIFGKPIIKFDIGAVRDVWSRTVISSTISMSNGASCSKKRDW